MSLITRTYTFSDGTTAYGSQVESEIANVVNTLNNLNTATSTWGIVKAVNSASTPLIADNSTGSNNVFEGRVNGVAKTYIDGSGNLQVVGSATIATLIPTAITHTLLGYRRPNLKPVNVTQVDVENNTGTANQTSILFPDGNVLSVTEDTSSTNKYRRFDITAIATFTAGTEDSGLRTGITEATNTWYAIYAVKSQINAANFVLSGDTTLPLQANFATLNSRYGTNSWVYLGCIRNGDNAGATGDLLLFRQSGPLTQFYNVGVGTAFTCCGTLLATTASAASVTYTYATGTGTTSIPDNVGHIIVTYAKGGGGAGDGSVDAGAATGVLWKSDNTVKELGQLWAPFGQNVRIVSGASGVGMDLFLTGFYDTILAATGTNPFL